MARFDNVTGTAAACRAVAAAAMSRETWAPRFFMIRRRMDDTSRETHARTVRKRAQVNRQSLVLSRHAACASLARRTRPRS
eukprot:6901549-Prymnesium_polylepis.1